MITSLVITMFRLALANEVIIASLAITIEWLFVYIIKAKLNLILNVGLTIKAKMYLLVYASLNAKATLAQK